MKQRRPLVISIAPRTIFLALFLVLLSLLVLKLTDIILLIGFSVLFAAALHPGVRWLMSKLKVPKAMAVVIMYLIVIIISVLIVISVIPAVSAQVSSLSQNWPAYQQSIINSFHNTPTIQNLLSAIFEKMSQNSTVIVTRLATVTLGAIVSLFGFITVLILTAYFLVGGKALASRFMHFLPEKDWTSRGLQILERISNKLGYWLRGQFVLCLIIFISHYIGLSIIGVDYALTLSLLAALLETIPTFGAWIAGTASVLVALAASPGKAIATAIMVLVIQQIQGNIITPQVMKRALGVPAVMIIISLLVFGKLFGLVGVFVAAPMAAIVAILFQEFGPDSRRLWHETKNNNEAITD